MIANLALWKQHYPEFAASNDAIVIQFMESASLVTVDAGQQVFYPGKPCESYLLLLSGSVKAQILSEDGREILLYHVKPGDSCVLTTSCLLSDDHYPAEAYTETEISAFAIPAVVFHRCLKVSPFFRDFVFRNFSQRLLDVIKRMEAISFGSIERRLAKLLIEESSSTLVSTHQSLANELNTAREVVSRQLKRFETLGWLSLSRGRIEIINVAALQEMAKGIR